MQTLPSDPKSSGDLLKKHQIGVWVLTFIIYATFHMARKTYSIVKGSLISHEDEFGQIVPGYAPFDGTDGKTLLGTLDTIFLTFYAICLFFAGHIGDRSNLRVFLPLGLLGSALGLLLWPIAYMLNIHSFGFFVVANVISGVFQSSGWPAVVCVMSRWFPKGKRGLIMGIWNSHTSIGNMLGSLVCAAMIHYTMDGQGWPYAFATPAIVTIVVAVLTALFLIPHPADVGLTVPETDVVPEEDGSDLNVVTAQPADDLSLEALGRDGSMGGEAVSSPNDLEKPKAVTFMTAMLIPGVLEFSFALFFCKLVAYTFLFWLPYYLKNFFEPSKASYLSIYFDMGGIIGGICAGVLSDKYKKPALISVSAMVICMPLLMIYRYVSEQQLGGSLGNACVMFILGAFVNGPYALITTAVSADLGSHPMLGSDASALATVSGIVDGMGTAGAAVQGVLVSLVSTINAKDSEENWDAVFYMLITCCGLAAVLLTRVVAREVKEMLAKPSRRGVRVLVLTCFIHSRFLCFYLSLCYVYGYYVCRNQWMRPVNMLISTLIRASFLSSLHDVLFLLISLLVPSHSLIAHIVLVGPHVDVSPPTTPPRVRPSYSYSL